MHQLVLSSVRNALLGTGLQPLAWNLHCSARNVLLEPTVIGVELKAYYNVCSVPLEHTTTTLHLPPSWIAGPVQLGSMQMCQVLKSAGDAGLGLPLLDVDFAVQ